MEYYASLISRILKIWKSPNLDGVRSREMRRALLSFIPRTPKLTSISKSEFMVDGCFRPWPKFEPKSGPAICVQK